jgi:cytoskeletal protein RodZ
MQPIQDKDFDNLFKNTFADAEIEPSRDLWASIESEIEPKKKRIIPVYWFAAAAVLIVATIGFLIYKQQNVAPKQFANHVEPKVEQSIKETSGTQDSSVTIQAPVNRIEETLPANAKPVTTIASTKIKEDVKPVEKQKIVTAPEAVKQETQVAKVDEPKKEVLKQKIEEAILKPSEEIVIASNLNQIKTDEPINNNEQLESKGIRNVGDVVNLIVNKVDKRKDKFIQFRTDDDDSSLASINIGPFRIGKKKK